MNDPKVYNGPDGKQVGEWKRLWSSPRAAFDTQIDPHSAADFVKATARGKGTLGELWDRSAELSAKRADKEGVDPQKQSFYKEFSRRHGGKKHGQQVREEGVRALKERGIIVEGLD